MSFKGRITCRSATMGDTENFTVAPTGVAVFPLGNPTYVQDRVYPEVGRTNYSADTGLGLTNATTPSEAFSKVDSWLDTYLLDAPPRLTTGSAVSTVEYLGVSWSNPPQKKLAFFTAYVPQISRLKADIVPSADNTLQDWSASSTWSVTLETISSRPTVTELRFILDAGAGTSNVQSGVYRYYGTTAPTRIIAQTEYDIRVYAENDATLTGAKSPRYITFLQRKTLASGVPAAPSAPTVSSITTTSATADWSDLSNEDRDIDSSATPFIVQYRVNVTATGSVRFGGALTNHTSPQATTLTSGADSPSILGLSTLNPGTGYSITVQARNALNIGFGAASTAATFTTVLPTAPSWPSSTGLTLANQASLQYPTGAGARTLDGSTSVSPVLRYSILTGGTLPTTSLVTARTNQTVADTASSTGTLEAWGGVTNAESDTASVTTVGFGRTFNGLGNTDNTSIRLQVTEERDPYNGSSSAGFYRQASVQAVAIAPSTSYRSSNSSYSLYLRFVPTGGSTVTTNRVSFWIDELDALPVVTATGITSITSSGGDVTGVPTLASSTTMGFQAIITNLAHRFLRTDRQHFQAVVQTSGGSNLTSTLTVAQSDMNGSTRSYYTAPSQTYEVSTTKHNTTGATLAVGAGAIQFHEFTLSFSAASNVFNEGLKLRVTPYNLVGTGTARETSGWVSTSDGSSKPVRIDTASLTSLGSMSGALMQAGSGQFPSSGFTSSYTDHTSSIVGTDQLQMVNGQWITPPVGTGYKDYSGFFTGGPDYSGISSSGWRYVCTRFQNLKGSGTYDSVRMQFSSSGLTLTPSSDSANFRLYLKIVNGGSSTPWVSATASINPSGYTAISSDGQGAMNNASATVGNIVVFVPTGTPASATVYVRCGLDMSLSQTVSGLTCVAL